MYYTYNKLINCNTASSCMKSLTVLIPAYNEEKLLSDSVLYYYHYLKKLQVDFEIIICANGCTDRTLEISKVLSTKYPQIRYLDIPQKGFGIALTTGILAARKELTTLMPADAEIKAEFIENALQHAEDHDYISASRRLAKEYRGKNGFRKFANNLFSLIVRTCFKFRITEVGTVRVWPTAWGKKRAPQITAIGFEWQIEHLYWALKDRLHIKEIPVYTQGRRPASESSVRLLKDTLPMLMSCIKYGLKLM